MEPQAIIALVVLVAALLLLCGAAWLANELIDRWDNRRSARQRASVDEIFRQDAAREALRRMYDEEGEQ